MLDSLSRSLRGLLTDRTRRPVGIELRRPPVDREPLTAAPLERMMLRVEQRARGRNDRHAMLSPQLVELKREWWPRADGSFDIGGSAVRAAVCFQGESVRAAAQMTKLSFVSSGPSC